MSRSADELSLSYRVPEWNTYVACGLQFEVKFARPSFTLMGTRDVQPIF